MTKPQRMHAAQRGAAIYSKRVLRMYDIWVLGFSNRFAWRCPTRSVLLPFFAENLSANHLDVGVGSGFYPAHSTVHPGQKMTLLDLNENSLQAASQRIAGLKPVMIHEDVLKPQGALLDRTFSSISLFYLLHCLPGQMAQKAFSTFDFLRGHLTPDGTLYGATILGYQANHNWLGRRLMKLYNRKGIFGNEADTLASLESALRHHFARVHVRQVGKVALFRAEAPLS